LTSAAFAATGARRPRAAGARRSFWNSFIGPHTKTRKTTTNVIADTK
jgi:hypothetical protein